MAWHACKNVRTLVRGDYSCVDSSTDHLSRLFQCDVHINRGLSQSCCCLTPSFACETATLCNPKLTESECACVSPGKGIDGVKSAYFTGCYCTLHCVAADFQALYKELVQTWIQHWQLCLSVACLVNDSGFLAILCVFGCCTILCQFFSRRLFVSPCFKSRNIECLPTELHRLFV